MDQRQQCRDVLGLRVNDRHEAVVEGRALSLDMPVDEVSRLVGHNLGARWPYVVPEMSMLPAEPSVRLSVGSRWPVGPCRALSRPVSVERVRKFAAVRFALVLFARVRKFSSCRSNCKRVAGFGCERLARAAA